MTEPQDYLADGSPLITAAQLGKLRLVRLLVEGGAQVNERNQRGETPLLAACRALRGNQSGSAMLKLIRFLLKNHADTNIQDKAGRTSLMYACMERAGSEVASALISAGADPSMEDYAGASALVYAINAHDQDTTQMLLDACRAKGRDIIIIATDLSSDGATVTRRYLNVPPSPNTSPVSCMSPSDIELKTNSPNSEAEGENIFNFRASGKRGSRVSSPLPPEADLLHHQRLHSEPWLAIHNLAHLSHTYDQTVRHRTKQEEEGDKAKDECGPSYSKRINPSHAQTFCISTAENLGPSRLERLHSRRNTLPVLNGQNLLQLPTLSLNLSNSDTRLNEQPTSLTLPPVSSYRNLHHSSSSSSCLSLAPPAMSQEFHTMRKWKPQEQLCGKSQASSTGFLPPLPTSSSVNTQTRSSTSVPNPPQRPEETQDHKTPDQRGQRYSRRHSIQLEKIKQKDNTEEILFVL